MIGRTVRRVVGVLTVGVMLGSDVRRSELVQDTWLPLLVHGEPVVQITILVGTSSIIKEARPTIRQIFIIYFKRISRQYLSTTQVLNNF